MINVHIGRGSGSLEGRSCYRPAHQLERHWGSNCGQGRGTGACAATMLSAALRQPSISRCTCSGSHHFSMSLRPWAATSGRTLINSPTA